jgi:hypothetical protein
MVWRPAATETIGVSPQTIRVQLSDGRTLIVRDAAVSKDTLTGLTGPRDRIAIPIAQVGYISVRQYDALTTVGFVAGTLAVSIVILLVYSSWALGRAGT